MTERTGRTLGAVPEWIKDIRTMRLESRVRMKLTSFRDKDRVHVRVMIAVGLVDESWLTRFSPQLR